MTKTLLIAAAAALTLAACGEQSHQRRPRARAPRRRRPRPRRPARPRAAHRPPGRRRRRHRPRRPRRRTRRSKPEASLAGKRGQNNFPITRCRAAHGRYRKIVLTPFRLQASRQPKPSSCVARPIQLLLAVQRAREHTPARSPAVLFCCERCAPTMCFSFEQSSAPSSRAESSLSRCPKGPPMRCLSD